MRSIRLVQSNRSYDVANAFAPQSWKVLAQFLARFEESLSDTLSVMQGFDA